MAFVASDTLTAARLNRLQPKSLYAAATGTVAASQTNVTVPGCSITFNTETNNATVEITWWVSFYGAAVAPTTFGSARAILDGSGAPVFAMGDSRTANSKDTPSMGWNTTIAAAGSHTVLLQATTPANMTIAQYTALRVVVYEVV